MDRELRDIIEAQPRVRLRRGVRDHARDNWVGIAMTALWLLAQAMQTGGWFNPREHTDPAIAVEIRQLREEIEKQKNEYVRREVFDEVVRRVEQKIDLAIATRPASRTGG